MSWANSPHPPSPPFPSLASLHIVGAPLPTPSLSSPQTPSGSVVHGISIAHSVISPPTPAPSPSPKQRETQYARQLTPEIDVGEGGDEQSERTFRAWKGKGRANPDSLDLLERFHDLPPFERFHFLNSLVPELHLNEALVVSRKIEPLLRRDYLRELPLELALYCLSFVDEPKTLARAAQVSRYWSMLIQDEQLWRDLYARVQAYPRPSSATPDPTQRRMPSRSGSSSSSTKDDHKDGQTGSGARRWNGLYQGRSSMKRITPFGIEKRTTNPSSGILTDPADTSYKSQVKLAYLTENNWLHGGVVLAKHLSADDSVVTTLCFGDKYIVVGMANSKIHIFDAATGGFKRSLVGHHQGVWAMVLVSPPGATSASRTNKSRTRSNTGGSSSRKWGNQASSWRSSYGGSDGTRASQSKSESKAPLGVGSFSFPGFTGTDTSYPEMFENAYVDGDNESDYDQGEESGGVEGTGRGGEDEEEDSCGNTVGWEGLNHHLVVSGGCDRDVRVWNVETGKLMHALPAHTSTIRCLKVCPRSPLAVSGSRDYTLRVWDLQKGQLKHTLVGHMGSVRCVEVSEGMAVSGSYDRTARLWDLESGECLHVFSGHYAEIYSVAFSNHTIITGSLDSTVRVWSSITGECLALLQGHTALVGQLQLSQNRLVTGGSDGRVIIFDIPSISCVHRICAHDNSVTTLQSSPSFVVSGGNDGRVKLWNTKTGEFVRELTKPCEAVWRVGFKGDRLVVLCQREGRTSLEVISFRPGEGEKRRFVAGRG